MDLDIFARILAEDDLIWSDSDSCSYVGGKAFRSLDSNNVRRKMELLKQIVSKIIEGLLTFSAVVGWFILIVILPALIFFRIYSFFIHTV